MSSITARLVEGYAVDVATEAGHSWRVDEPEDRGGTGTGPNPYELLVGALAACTCITLSMYARRKGWKLDSVEATYRHDRVHVDDCTECEDDAKGYIDRIRSTITIAGDLDQEQRRRLAEVAARCPVHKTLDKSVHMVDEVEFA